MRKYLYSICMLNLILRNKCGVDLIVIRTKGTLARCFCNIFTFSYSVALSLFVISELTLKLLYSNRTESRKHRRLAQSVVHWPLDRFQRCSAPSASVCTTLNAAASIPVFLCTATYARYRMTV